MRLSHHQREGAGLVIRPSYEVDEQTEKRLRRALVFMIVLLLVVYGIEQYDWSRQIDTTYEPSHDIILWTESENYTYEVEVSFYTNGQDAMYERNRVTQTSVTVRSDMPEMVESVVYNLPYTQDVFWVRVGFGKMLAEDEWEWVYRTGTLRLGVKLVVNLEGHEFAVLVRAAE